MIKKQLGDITQSSHRMNMNSYDDRLAKNSKLQHLKYSMFICIMCYPMTSLSSDNSDLRYITTTKIWNYLFFK